MRPIVDLGNYGSVVSGLNILKNVFNAPVTDPNYMPVTRDLSEAKRTMIRTWLNNPVYKIYESAEDLMQALQLAIELEHSTIPPYLCALYSIKPGTNVEVAGLIRSVVVEEMLHMALVANIFIAIGGSPNIGHAKFVNAGTVAGRIAHRPDRPAATLLHRANPRLFHVDRGAGKDRAHQAAGDAVQREGHHRLVLRSDRRGAGSIKRQWEDQIRQRSAASERLDRPGAAYVIKSLDDAKKAIEEM